MIHGADWYKTEVTKLLAIVKSENKFIAKDYLEEKIVRILQGTGIILHPTLQAWVEEFKKEMPQ